MSPCTITTKVPARDLDDKAGRVRFTPDAFSDRVGRTIRINLANLGGGVVDGVLRAAAVAPDGATVALAIEVPVPDEAG